MDIILLIKKEYKQVIFVCIAFFIMILASYAYVSSIMKRHIDVYNRTIMHVHSITLRNLVVAHEAALNQSVSTLKIAIKNKAKPNDLLEILTKQTELYREQKNIKDVFLSVYGYIDGNFLDGAGLILDEYYNPKISPWFRGAILQQGLYYTKPYKDSRTGQVVSAISTAIYDDNGESHGVIAIDYLLNPIIKQVTEFSFGGMGYGVLIDSSLNVLSHPIDKYIGQNIDMLPGCSGLSDKLKSIKIKDNNKENDKDDIIIEKIVNERVKKIAFFSRLENGWYLGIVSPERFYYSAIYNMIPIIACLGFALAVPLCYLLLSHTAAKYRSQEESRLKSSFLARMSHEIRTPMNAVIGMSDLAIRDYGQPEGLNRLLEIRRAGKNLMSIINDILDISKIESSTFLLSNKPYELDRLISDVISIINIRTKDKDLDFVVDIDKNIPRGLIGDDTALRQIMLNLLSNAVKYTPKGQVKLLIRGFLQHLEFEPKVNLLITVIDTGVGIQKENMGKLFEDFVRIEQEGHRYIEGTGLGLAIVSNLCKKMEGTVTVESEYGKGSIFTASVFQLINNIEPIGQIDNSLFTLIDNEIFIVPFKAPNCRVLVVDDNLTNLIIAKGYLEAYDMQITLAQSGNEALSLVQNQDFDIFLIDQMMPEMDGISLMKKLRKNEEDDKKYIILAFTANAINGVRETLIEEGFDDFILKPIEENNLNEILEKFIPPNKKIDPNSPNKNVKNYHLSNEQNNEIDFKLLKGIDTSVGLRRCNNSEKIYFNILKIFLHEAEEFIDKVVAINTDNRQDLTIIFHSIKSACANIGALEVSKLAAFLEENAIKNNISIINAEINDFKEKLSKITVSLRAFINNFEHIFLNMDNKTNKVELDDADLLLQRLKMAITEKNFSQIDKLIELISISNYRSSVKYVNQIEESILVSEFDQALHLIDNMLTEV
jgi:signal transduction histidine kinase/CheY-like chemotaxis protein